MIKTAGSYPNTTKGSIRNHYFSHNSWLFNPLVSFFKQIAKKLPDLDFVINRFD
jgi:hypothetical protein